MPKGPQGQKGAPADLSGIEDEPGMAERFQRGLQRAFTMKPTHPTPKTKTRPASKGRAHKGKTGGN
jgi:hypothetical protein